MSASQATDISSAWRSYTEGLERIRSMIYRSQFAQDPQDAVRLHYWFMQAQAGAFNLSIAPRQDRPAFYTNTIFERSSFNWLLPNADFNYRYAFLDGADTYRIHGRLGTPRFIDAQIMSHAWGDPALRLMANHDLGQFAAADGSIEVFIAPEQPPGAAHWIKSDPDSRTNFFLVREAFYDWSEEPSRLDVELCAQPVGGGIDVNEAESVRRLEAATKLIQFCWDYFGGGLTQSVFDKVGMNRFYYVDTSSGRDGSHPAAGFVPALYEIAADEALLIEISVEQARYWSVMLGDVWLQAAEFMNHQSSLNGHQALPDSDGKVRLVIAAKDPGVQNWLDPIGNLRGIAMLRWYFAARITTPEIRVVAAARLRDYLPPETRLISPQRRAEDIARRRQAMPHRLGH